MGIKLTRQKKRNFHLTLVYNLFRFKFLSPKNRMKLFLNFEWIFNRLAHEESFKIYELEKHPVRLSAISFLSKYLKKDFSVFDLGCNSGDLGYLISKHVKQVTGVDYNKQLINSAKNKYTQENILFIESEANHYLANNKSKYDVLILSHILEHLDDPLQFLQNYVSYFDYVYIEIPDFDYSFTNLYRNDIGIDLIYTDIDHVSEFDRYEITNIINDAGLEIIESEFKFGFQRYWCIKIIS
jgi:SAM-dependent methyltransferase